MQKKKRGRQIPHNHSRVLFSSDELQHHDWSSYNTHRAGPSSHMSKCFSTIIIHQSLEIFTIHTRIFGWWWGEEKKVATFPQEASTTLRSHDVPSHHHTQCCHPCKQQTSTWEQSSASQPAPPPPTEAGAHYCRGSVKEDGGYLKGFPNRSPGTSRGP